MSADSSAKNTPNAPDLTYPKFYISIKKGFIGRPESVIEFKHFLQSHSESLFQEFIGLLFLLQCIHLLWTTISDNISLKSNFIKSSAPFSVSNSTLLAHTVFVAQHMFLFSIFDYKKNLVVFPYLQFLNDKIDQNTKCAKLPSVKWLFCV